METKSHNYFKIEPDLSDDHVAFIDDWRFTHWPNKPKGDVVRNPDGTFSLSMEKDFIPLVEQLLNLFKDDNAPENGSYLGEAILTGKDEPTDCIHGNFINKKLGLVISDRLLEVFKTYHLPQHFVYKLPLIKNRKRYDDYNYIYFKNSDNAVDSDIRLVMDGYTKVVCISEKLKEDICNFGIKGCTFTLMNTGK